jgi:hypothetical protein
MTDTITTKTNKPYACDQGCRKSFVTKKVLGQHKNRGCRGVEEKEKISVVCEKCRTTFKDRKAKTQHVKWCSPKGAKETPLLVDDAGSSVADDSTVDLSCRNQDNISMQIERALPAGEEEFKEPAKKKPVRLSIEAREKVSLCVTDVNPYAAKRFALKVIKRAATIRTAVENIREVGFAEEKNAYSYSSDELHFVMIESEDPA